LSSPQRIPRGCKRENGEVGDETVGKLVIVPGDCVSNDIRVTGDMNSTNIKRGMHTGIDGGDENIIVWRFGV
jgi:hypothetical protein